MGLPGEGFALMAVFRAIMLACLVQDIHAFIDSLWLPHVDYVRANGTGPLPMDRFPKPFSKGGVEQVKLAYSQSGMKVSWLSQSDAPSSAKYGTSREVDQSLR